MKSYYDLIREGIIDFKTQLLEHYSSINLDEIECLIIYKLYQYEKENDNSLNINKIASKMSLSIDELSNIIASLVSKGYIELKADENSEIFREEYSINPTIKELAYYLENGDKLTLTDETGELVKKTVTELEKILNKPLSPFELQTVSKWFYECKYEYSLIEEELKKLSFAKFPNINLLDRNLKASKDNSLTENDIIRLQEALKKKYGK